MAKYYVTSGEMEVVIAGPHIESAKDAACEAILSFRNYELAPLIVVSEQGFDLSYHKQDVVFSTVEIAKLCGLTGE
jgi:hypothetical protein